ncbi:hypothetical protein F5Y17DRAFT_418548 [Xylariaceae sp. FL0594]|nr:hypothetical protein F5Y17DRAFT_418548 [Xylariaceae sp. FL0594]
MPPSKQDKVYECATCQETFRTSSMLSQHKILHVGTQCRWAGCGRHTLDEKRMLAHLRWHQDEIVSNKPSPDIAKLICQWPGCGTQFSRQDSAKRCVYKHQKNADQAAQAAAAAGAGQS